MKRQRAPRQVVPVAVSEIQLPATPFLYTLDQVAVLINKSQKDIEKQCHFIGRSLRDHKLHQLRVMNVAAPGNSPDWRVSESEFIRWLIRHGYQPTKYHY